jgi:hypothetical protein
VISPQLRPIQDQLTALLQRADALRSQFQQSKHELELELESKLAGIQQEVRLVEEKKEL